MLTESVTSPGRIRLRTEEASLESCEGAGPGGAGADHGPLCAGHSGAGAAIVTTCESHARRGRRGEPFIAPSILSLEVFQNSEKYIHTYIYIFSLFYSF